jgi:hypothetical protein
MRPAYHHRSYILAMPRPPTGYDIHSPRSEIYIATFPYLQFKQLYRVSHFDPTGTALTPFIIIFNSCKSNFSDNTNNRYENNHTQRF